MLQGMSGLPDQSVRPPAKAKEPRAGARRIGDLRQWLGTSGDASGTSGTRWRTFLYALAAMAALVGAVNTINVLTVWHEEPAYGTWAPVVWEGSSWVSWLLFFWIVWIFYRLAPPFGRPRWRLLLHPVGAVLFSLAHVGAFVALRGLVYRLDGHVYEFGAFWPHFFYELGKDAFGYALAIGGFALMEQLALSQARPAGAAMFTIRDGAKIARVAVSDILAVSSAGNYVEFALRDGRRLLMRTPLSAIETELMPHGFVRVHRSWLVNAMQMTGLKPEGSGDYTVELGSLSVPLSRRFPEALAKLRAT